MKKWMSIGAFILLGMNIVAAQGVGNDEVLVVRELEANIADAQKLDIAPEIPDFSFSAPVLSFNVQIREFKNFSFEPNPAKPLGMSREKLEKHNTSYLRLGFGSQFTPLAELAYHDNHSKNFRFGLTYDHLSSKAQRENQQFNSDRISLYARYLRPKAMIGAGFRFSNLRNHFYGYSDTSYSRQEVMQRYRQYGASLSSADIAPNKANIRFHALLDFNHTEEYKGAAREFYILNRYDLSKSIKKIHNILFKFDYDFSRYQQTAFRLDRNLNRIGAGYCFDNDDWMGRAFISVGVDGKKAYPLPDLEMEKRLYKNVLIAFAGWNIRLDKNSLESLSTLNNFILSRPALLNTRTDNRFVGLKGIYEGLSWRFLFSNKVIHNAPLFVNDTTDSRRFETRYDKVTDYNFSFGLSYDWKSQLHIAVEGNYHALSADRESRPWHMPAFDLNFKARYNLRDKFLFSLDVISFAGIKALDPVSRKEAVIKGTADLSLSCTYVFNKRFSFFARLNNLANQKFQRWYNYPLIGFNGLAGAQFSF